MILKVKNAALAKNIMHIKCMRLTSCIISLLGDVIFVLICAPRMRKEVKLQFAVLILFQQLAIDISRNWYSSRDVYPL